MSPKEEYSDNISNWLRINQHSRQWLSEQIGCTYGTLNQWFSKGFPDWAKLAIERLINPPGTEEGGLEVTFTAREFERIEEARKLLGIATRKLYYEEAIAEYTDQILAREAADKTTVAQNIAHFPATQPSTRAAEEPGHYDSSSGGKEKKKQHTDKTGTED